MCTLPAGHQSAQDGMAAACSYPSECLSCCNGPNTCLLQPGLTAPRPCILRAAHFRVNLRGCFLKQVKDLSSNKELLRELWLCSLCQSMDTLTCVTFSYAFQCAGPSLPSQRCHSVQKLEAFLLPMTLHTSLALSPATKRTAAQSSRCAMRQMMLLLLMILAVLDVPGSRPHIPLVVSRTGGEKQPLYIPMLQKQNSSA